MWFLTLLFLHHLDSLSPLQHDSAYETDADGEKGSCVQLASVLDESLISGTSTPAKETCNTFTRPFIRRRSEPVITLPQSVRVQPLLTRSQTSSLLRLEDDGCCCQSMLLRKQISDECIVQRSWRSLDGSLAHGQRCIPSSSESCVCGSSRSLESAFSSASESSVFANSPPASPSCQRRSLPCEAVPTPSSYSQPQEHQECREPTLQRRSQSLRYAATHNRAALRRGGSSRMTRDKKVLLQSCALPEDMEVLRKPPILSSAEVFQQVDSRIPGLPPSYEQATQSTPLSCSSPAMTVQEARRLSAQKDPALNTHPTDQTQDLLNNPVTKTVTSGLGRAPLAMSAMVCRTRSISESNFKAPAKSLLRRCSQPLFEELMHAQESYVWDSGGASSQKDL